MSPLFVNSSSGIPISLITTKNYDVWLSKQNPVIKSWLNSNHYSGSGVCVIPDKEGAICRIIFGIPERQGFFIAGDISTQIPPSQYILEEVCESLYSNNDSLNQLITDFAISWGLSNYRFDKYKKLAKALPTLAIKSQVILDEAQNYIDSIYLIRNLINTPASDLMPEDFSKVVDQLADKYHAKVSHTVGDQLLDDNYPTIHAVGRASVHEPRLIDLTWGDENAPKITLVGKGVCFDSGGLDLKPANGMRLMKKDMGGAAHVLGLANLIMAEKLPIQLRVLIPAVENAVSSNAFRPGDVIKTRQGLTVEVDNTDAEGRLVLCDALTEACSEKPNLILDFATLTGACRVALGTELPGFFCNDEQVASSLVKSGLSVHDPMWQLPLHQPYQEMLKSDIADTLNSAASGFGGAITAALYLQLFITKNTPWVHFDVMAWNNRKLPGRPIGGEAFAIRAVYDYLKDKYKKN